MKKNLYRAYICKPETSLYADISEVMMNCPAECLGLVCILWLLAGAIAFHTKMDKSVLTVNIQGDQVIASFVTNSEADHKNGILLCANRHGFKVKSINNKDLVSMQVLKDGKSQFIKILDTGFIQFQGKDHVIPHHLLVEAQSLTEKGDIKTFTNKVSKHTVSMQSAKLVFKNAIRRLASKQESRLFLQAFEALGNDGITGASHSQMLPLYIFATHLPHSARQQRKQQLREDWANQQCSKPHDNINHYDVFTSVE